MRLAFAVVALIALLPAIAWPACSGQDLAPTLTPQETARLDARLDGAPFTSGNHWRAVRGDTVIHLVGTIHAGDARLDAPLTRLALLVARAGALLLEATAIEQSRLERVMRNRPDLFLLPGTTLPELLPEDDWQALARAVEARGLPRFMAARMRPWYLSVIVSIPGCLDIATAMAGGLDAKLEGIAQDEGIPVRPLEPFDTALTAFESVSLDDQLDMLRVSLAAPGTAEDLLETLMAAYFRQEHAAGWARSEILAERFAPLAAPAARRAFALTERLLLEDRNRAWVPVILETSKAADSPIVVAFGAAHLSGATGIPALLEAEGFTLARQPF